MSRRKMQISDKKKFKLDKDAQQRIEMEFSDVESYDIEEPAAERKKHPFLRKLIIRSILLCAAVLLINLVIMLYTGQLWFNEPRKRDYPVRGPVITEKEGKISWNSFAQQNIQLVFIRATKSTAYEDENFQTNKSGVTETDLPVGALHIFDFNMDGKEQAKHFIDVCGNMNGWLKPAVEVKITGFMNLFPTDYDKVSERLYDFVEEIKSYYGSEPIIKCSSRTYKNIVSDERFDNCPVWYESQYSKIDDDIRWDFWGYSNRVKFSYYESGDYLGMVLFNGDENKFADMYL